jgi:hypothetical protein
MVDPQAVEVEEEELAYEPDERDQLIDDWFGDEDASADDEEEEEEESSPYSEPDDHGPDDEVSEEDAEEPASKKSTSAESKDKGDDPENWVSQLDPEFREKAEALVHSSKSDKGRVAALQRRIDSILAQQEAQEKTQPTTAAAKQAVVDGKPLEDMDDEELAAFMEEFPTVAKNVEKLFEKRFAREREELLGQVRPLQQAQLQQQIEQRKAALRERASHIFNTAETGVELDDVVGSRAFHDWIANQTQGYVEFARKAEEVDDATKVLEDFARYMDGQVTTQLGTAARTAEAKTAQSADHVAARRKQALKGTGVKSRSAEVSTGRGDDDYDAYFNKYTAEIQRSKK